MEKKSSIINVDEILTLTQGKLPLSESINHNIYYIRYLNNFMNLQNMQSVYNFEIGNLKFNVKFN